MSDDEKPQPPFLSKVIIPKKRITCSYCPGYESERVGADTYDFAIMGEGELKRTICIPCLVKMFDSILGPVRKEPK